MNFKKITALYKKEIKDVLRDKKTILMMLVVPLVLYPLIMFGSIQVMSMVAQNESTTTYHIGLGFEEEVEAFANMLLEEKEDITYDFDISDSHDAEQLADLLSDGELNAYLTVEEQENGQKQFLIHYISSETASRNAADALEEELGYYNTILQKDFVTALMDVLDKETVLVKGSIYTKEAGLKPVTVEFEDIASTEESIGNIIGSILPFLLITSLLLGAIYPAIDVTAGERERGTLETMLTLPISNAELLTGKFLVVSTITIVSALLNMISMAFMGIYLYQSVAIMDDAVEGGFSINFMSFLPAFLIAVLCVIAFALLLSALSMCFCSFARSFKEANNYITPLMLIVMIAGYAGFLPNVKLNNITAMIPAVNISILIRDIFHFSMDYSLVFLVIVSNLTCAVVAVFILSRLYNSEQLLFGAENGSFQFLESRKNMKKGSLPSPADAILVLAIVLLAFLYIGSLLQTKYMLYGVLGSELLIAGLVLAAAIYAKNDMKKLFSLRLPTLSGTAGSIFLICGGYLLNLLLSVALSQVLTGSSNSINETFNVLLEGEGFLKVFLVIAVAGPVCEELVFRGYLYGGLRSSWLAKNAILLSALFFGIYHMNLIKLFTTGFLGILMAYAVEKTKSISSSIVMHIINNGAAVLLLFYGEKISSIFPFLFEESISALEIVLLAIIGIILSTIGLFLLKMQNKKIQ